jgi:metal-sulfur cluster biosynthetic enzyme
VLQDIAYMRLHNGQTEAYQVIVERLKYRIKGGSIVVKNISEADVRQAVGQVMHPEISCTLVELGMVKDITVKDDEVSLTLVLPLLGIPTAIKEYLVDSLRQAMMKLGVKVEVGIAEMNQEERLAFFDMEQKNWKGL